MERRLAAVLAADVVGYSRLMEADSTRMLATLRRLRAEVFGPAVAGHRGQLIKSMGDGWIVTFANIADAVNCALKTQEKLGREIGIDLRIGIHVGDVTQDGEDVFGDGVNVAARLETLCRPGGVILSDAVHGALDGTLRPAFDDGGEMVLKNIDRPVRVWHRGGLDGHGAASRQHRPTGLPVLQLQPFTVSDRRDDVRELAHAVLHDLDAALAGLRWMRCEVSIAPLYGAHQFSGTLRASGDRLRLETRLQSPTGNTIWRGKHDGRLEDLFDWQDVTGLDLANHILVEVMASERANLEHRGQDSWSAEDWVTMTQLGITGSRDSLEAAIGCLVEALRIDPDHLYACELGAVYTASARILGYQELGARWRAQGRDWIARAEKLRPPDRLPSTIFALARYVDDGDTARAVSSALRCLERDPNDHDTLNGAAWIFTFTGAPDRAIECHLRYLDLARHALNVPISMGGMALCLIQLGKYEKALDWARRSMERSPNYVAAYRGAAAALAHLDRLEEAREMMEAHRRIMPDQTISNLRESCKFVDTLGTRRYFDGLRKAGMPD